MAQEKHLFPFVCRTIRAPISDAFVAVAGAGKSGTRDIKQNAAHSTFLWHAFLSGWGLEGPLILPLQTSIAKKADIFCPRCHGCRWAGGRPVVEGYGGLLRHQLPVDEERRTHRSSYAFSVGKEMFAFLPAVDVPPALIPVHDRSRQRALTTRAFVLAEFGAKVHAIS